jgi:hypothetical protein
MSEKTVESGVVCDAKTRNPKRLAYQNRNNPAVALIEKVIEKKSENRKEVYNFLEYKQYEKIQFALSNISDKFKKGEMFGKFRSIFEDIDTSKRVGNSVLHFFIRETLSDNYYRRNPETSKEIVRAEKTVNLDEYLDENGISAHIAYIYQHINIYDNKILFLTNKFTSPIANNAPHFYRFYIVDTLKMNDVNCIRVFFEPRNKADFLFHGNLYITLDGSYAIRKIDMGINDHINIDWVQDISVTQDFEKYGQKSWLLSKEDIEVDFGILKNSMGLFGQRTISLKDYKINEPIAEEVFRGPEKIEKIEPSSYNPEFWESNRYFPFDKAENGLCTRVDSIKKIPAFKRRMNLIMLITNGFWDLGKVEIGPYDSFFSFNTIEGSRVRFGGMTTPDFSKKITFDGYMAYGFTDKKIKYSAGVTYSLTPGTIYQFPVRSIRFSYLSDNKVPGQELQFSHGDNLFLSFKRGISDKLLYNKIFKAEYLNEFENHFSCLAGFSFNRQSPVGNLYFNSKDYSTFTNTINYINISELYLNLRYAPNEQFYQGRLYRSPFPGTDPVVQFKIAVGSKLLINDYNYLRLQMNVGRRYYVSIFGYTDVSLEVGKILGKVPYPLLFIHTGNQTYTYQGSSYNMMDFLEFVSDQYASLNVEHCFNGFILNKIPLIKMFNLREIVTFKILYGGVSINNNPNYQSNLIKFPTDKNGVPQTFTLEKQPYIESGIGLSNILTIFRIDLIERFSFLDHPDISDIGFLLQLRFDL